MVHAPSPAPHTRSARRRTPSSLTGFIITPALVGVGAYARLVRDGSLRELSTGVAGPHAIGTGPYIRALSVAHLVPARGALTGVAALWVHGWAADGPIPVGITIAALPGVRLSEPAGTHVAWRAITHESSVARSESIAGTAVAHPAAAVAAALGHDPLHHAIPAAWWALDVLRVLPRDLERLLPRKGPATRRAWSAWRAIRNARTGAYAPS